MIEAEESNSKYEKHFESFETYVTGANSQRQTNSFQVKHMKLSLKWDLLTSLHLILVLIEDEVLTFHFKNTGRTTYQKPILYSQN